MGENVTRRRIICKRVKSSGKNVGTFFPIWKICHSIAPQCILIGFGGVLCDAMDPESLEVGNPQHVNSKGSGVTCVYSK